MSLMIDACVVILLAADEAANAEVCVDGNDDATDRGMSEDPPDEETCATTDL